MPVAVPSSAIMSMENHLCLNSSCQKFFALPLDGGFVHQLPGNSPIHVIVAADVEKNDLLFGDQEREGNPVAVDEAHGLATGKLASQGVERQVRLERVVLQVSQQPGEAGLELEMLLEELARLAQKLLWLGNGVHYAGSSPSRALSRSSAPLNRFTRPSFTSSRDARTRAR